MSFGRIWRGMTLFLRARITKRVLASTMVHILSQIL